VDDLDLRAQSSVHVMGKGRRERVLPLWKETAHALRAWQAVRGAARCETFFLSMHGVPLTRAGFEYILKRHVTTAGAKQSSIVAKRVSPHVLRHTCAMHTLQATHDIRKVALWLGHVSVQTAEIYLRADPQEKLEAIEAIVPPALRRGRFRAPDQLLAMLRTKVLPASGALAAAVEASDRSACGPPATAALDIGRRSRYSNGRLRT
jgi:site-specific recombinase XerC